MEVIHSAIGDLGVNTSHFQLCLDSVVGAELFLGKPTLVLSPLRSIFSRMAGIAGLLTLVRNEQIFNAKVNPNRVGCDLQAFGDELTPAGDKISPRRVLGHGDDAWCGRKLTRPSNVERFFALGNKELAANVFERARGEFSRLLVGLFLKGGVFSPASPKVLSGRLLMAKTLLKRDARHFAEIAKLRAFFDIGQTSVRLQVVNLVLVFVKLFRSPIKNCVVDLTNTAKRPRQQGFLLRCRVEPICEGAFARIHDLHCMMENVRMEPLIRPVGSVAIPPGQKGRGLARGN